jgi:hypothetical protein
MCRDARHGTVGGMTNSTKSRNTPAFYAQAAISFGLSLFGLLLSVLYMPVEAWMRAFIAVDALFMVSSAFTLAKCVRDAQEDDAVISRLDAARLERLLAEYDPYRTPGLPDPGRDATPEPPVPAPPPTVAYPGYAAR